MKHRIGRVEGEILRELTKILQKKIRDPRLSEVTITAVECTNDLSYATVYYSLLTEDAEKENPYFSFSLVNSNKYNIV